MKKYLIIMAASAIFCGSAAVAQDKKEKEKNKMDENEEIIILRKQPGKDAKVTIEIKDGEVTVDGKPIEDYDGNLTIRKRKPTRVIAGSPFRGEDSWNFNENGQGFFNIGDENQAFLGVLTEKDENGARITQVTDESAAEKAGLKKGDIITRLNDITIEDQDDLSKAVLKHKPEEKVTITYKRDGKENKLTATLGKRKGFMGNINVNPQFDVMPKMDFNFDHGELGQVFAYGGKPRLGIKAQDLEDGKGVKVLDVDEGSAADKAGIKKDDVITEFEGKAVANADELATAARSAKDKSSVSVKLNRDGKPQVIEIKTPKKLKTANL